MSLLTLSNEVVAHEKAAKDGGNTLFPVFLKLQNFHTLLVGGGNVGLEKLEALLGNSPDAEITIVADQVSAAVEQLAGQYPRVRVQRRQFEERDLEGVSLAILATDNVQLHRYIHELAVERNVLVNVADTPDLCDLYLGSVVKKGNLKIGISTNGKSPTMAKRLKEVFQAVIPEEIDDSLNQLNQIRNSLNGSFADKVKALNALTIGLVKPEKPSGHRGWRILLWMLLILVGAVVAAVGVYTIINSIF